MVKFSVNKKLNNILNDIYYDLTHISDTRKDSIAEVKHYMREFPKEPDYNIAQYGNVIIYYDDVREAYKKAGYGSSIDKMSDLRLWDTYKRQVGWVARYIRDHNKK